MKSFCPHGEILFVLWVSEARLVALLVSRDTPISWQLGLQRMVMWMWNLQVEGWGMTQGTFTQRVKLVAVDVVESGAS